jgi:RHS repeat-associated protein
MGVRQLDLVSSYTGYAYDQVLGLYYAKARMYDAANRRFTAADPVKGKVSDPQSMAQYTYVENNPLRYIDPLGMALTEWDKNNLTPGEQAQILAYTADWEAANKANNPDKKDAAHDAAEAVRDNHRTGTERGSDAKDGNTVGTPDIKKEPPKEPELSEGDQDILDEFKEFVNSYSDGELLDYVMEYGESEFAEALRAVIGSLDAGTKAKIANLLRQQWILDFTDALVNGISDKK